MNKAILFLSLAFISHYAIAQEVPSKEVQLKTAVLAAPEGSRQNVTIFGYNGDGELILLRKGTNELICLADDPNSPGLNVSCYHESLEPFMERGRQLKKEGKSAKEIFDIREEEVKSGKLKLKDGSSLFVLTADAKDYDTKTGEVKDSYLRSVVYIPWATVESTGLPLQPAAPGMPWIMDPGTHRAHIMINPARD